MYSARLPKRDDGRPFHVHHRRPDGHDGLAGERIIIGLLALVVLPAGQTRPAACLAAGRFDGVAVEWRRANAIDASRNRVDGVDGVAASQV